jgi:hypothetical protein
VCDTEVGAMDPDQRWYEKAGLPRGSGKLPISALD